MNYEEDESAICLYIDELKSDDQSLKMNAVDKITLICQHLSESRVCNEFFPYLRYIIQECDNEDEFLIRLSNNLTTYLQGLGGQPPVLTAAVQVFETMIIMEDPRVRDSAVQGFRFLGNFIFGSVAEMILKLGTSELQYGKMSCCNLIRVTIQDKTFREDMFPHCSKICLLLLEDDSMLVRRSALNALRFMWDSPSRDFPEHDLTVFSPKFLEKIQLKYRQLEDNGLVYELLHREFFSRFLNLKPLDKRVEVQMELLEKLLFFLSKSHVPKVVDVLTGQDESSNIDKFWKVKYMLSYNLSLLLQNLVTPNFYPSFISEMTRILNDFPQFSGIIKDKDSSSLEQAQDILINLIQGLYRHFISKEMIEVRSAFIAELIKFCGGIDSPKFQLSFLVKLVDIFNEFILYDESFYVKMKTSAFLGLMIKVALKNRESEGSVITFSKLTFLGEPPTPQIPEIPKEEPKQFLVNEKVVKSTSVVPADFTVSNVFEHAMSVFQSLDLDPSIEIYKGQLHFLKVLLLSSSSSPEVRTFLNDIVQRMKQVPSKPNIKYRIQTAEYLTFFLSNCKPTGTTTYLSRPLLPLKVPKTLKSETQLITLTGRSHSRQLTDMNNSEEGKINQMNIKFALSTMYKGYLVTLKKPPVKDTMDWISKFDVHQEDAEFPGLSSKRILNNLISPGESMHKQGGGQFELEENTLKQIEESLLGFAGDVTVAVRNRTLEACLALAHVLPKSRFEEVVDNLLKKWTSHKSFMYRVSAIHLVALLALIPDFQVFGRLFGNIIRNGLKEKVLNVKLCLLRLVGLINQLFPNLTQNNHQLKIMLDFFEGDVDKNVSRIAGIIQRTFQGDKD